jgi:hypothetical protein
MGESLERVASVGARSLVNRDVSGDVAFLCLAASANGPEPLHRDSSGMLAHI